MDERSKNLGKPIPAMVSVSFAGGVIAFLTAICCVLPMALMLVGLGGAWMAVFSPVVAVSLYVLPLAFVCLGIAWVVALRRHSSRRGLVLLSVSSGLTLLAGLIYVFQAQLNDFLISMM